MPKKLSDALEQGFLGDDTARRVGQTLPGQLAAFVDQMVYDVREVPAEPGKTPQVVFNRNTFVGVKEKVDGKPFPGFPGLDDGGNYADTVRALREVHDYLLACAVREVLRGK